MPEIEALIIAEGGKKVTITIAEISAEDEKTATSMTEDDPNSFSIQVGTNRLTITIAE